MNFAAYGKSLELGKVTPVHEQWPAGLKQSMFKLMSRTLKSLLKCKATPGAPKLLVKAEVRGVLHFLCRVTAPLIKCCLSSQGLQLYFTLPR